jgi:hypothetical protein
MGQTGSKTQVHVHIDKPYYYAGDIVTGFVVLHAETAMTFNSINIKVQTSACACCCTAHVLCLQKLL